MDNDAPLNFNPYDTGLVGIITNVVRKYISQMQTCIPAIVSKVVDRKFVIATPAVQQLNSQWTSVPWADIKLPVLVPYGGGIGMAWPLAAGDTGWIIAGDLDPSLFFKDPSRPQKQNVLNRHAYQFGFFVPDRIAGFNISAADDGALVIMTDDGKTKLSLKAGNVNITSSDTLNINGKSINIKTDDNASVVIDGVNWKNHKHDVTAGIGRVTVDPNSGANTAPLTWTSDGVKS